MNKSAHQLVSALDSLGQFIEHLTCAAPTPWPQHPFLVLSVKVSMSILRTHNGYVVYACIWMMECPVLKDKYISRNKKSKTFLLLGLENPIYS